MPQKQPKILLAGGNWRARALVLAQLVEEGFDVTAVGTWDEAEMLLGMRAVRPSLVVFDVEGEPHPEAALTTLRRLVGSAARAVVLTAPSILAVSAVRDLGFTHVLGRPYSVGEAVGAVRGALKEGGEMP